ncbi:OsmC family protein [Crocinitomix sp.]|nr:OsmC family protein [Crocinitomix sp.]
MIKKSIETTYQGGLRVGMIHLKSGSQIQTDAPTDNNGKGEAFSPTDLLAASLASCVLTIVGIHYQKKDIELEEMTCDVQKIMYPDPRRIGEILLEFDFGNNNFQRKDLEVIQRIVETCPVTLSLNESIKIETNIPHLLGEFDK